MPLRHTEIQFAQHLLYEHSNKLTAYINGVVDTVWRRFEHTRDSLALQAQWSTPMLQRAAAQQENIDPAEVFGGFAHTVGELFDLSEQDSSWGDDMLNRAE